MQFSVAPTKYGRTTSPTESGPIPYSASARRAWARIARWVSIVPFGSPVVPLV